LTSFGEKQTLSKNFTLSEKGFVTLKLEWDWKTIAFLGDRVVKVVLKKNNLVIIDSNNLAYTRKFTKMELPAGKYQITLFISKGILIRAILKTDQGLNL
jgi:hypothetical protein